MQAPGLRARLLLWGALLVATMVASGYGSVLAFSRVSRAMGDALYVDNELAVHVQTLTGALEDEDDALLLSLTGDASRARRELAAERHRFDEAFAALQSSTSDPEERASLAALARLVASYRARGDELIRLEGSEEARGLYRRELAPLLRQATARCLEIRERRFHQTQAMAAGARDEARRATVLVSLASAAALVMLGLVTWRVARTVVVPITELTESVEAVREGHFERRVETPSHDELGRLARGFNRMAESLEHFHASQLGEVLAANQTLEATLEALPEAVLVVSETGAITRTNARARDLLGVVEKIEDVPLPPTAAAAIREAAAGAAPRNPSRADLGRAMTLRIDGHRRLFLPRIVGVAHVRTADAAVVLVLDEVTDFARLDEARTEFIAAAAHELRTPLTTLRMTIALLEEAGSSLDERERETLATARMGCEQLASTVDAFLDVTRADAGQLVVSKGRVDAGGLVEQVTRGLAPRFEERHIALDVDARSDLLVSGDQARLAAALSNLLTNALKYSPAGGAVKVRGTREGESVRIVVEDDGPGVPADLRERVFEKYFRVEHVRPEHAEGARGAGIGLYLCRLIVEAHGGAVRCDGSDRGGSRFVVELPTA